MKMIQHFFLTTLVLLGSALTSWADYNGESVTPTTISGGEFDGYYAIGTAAELYGFAALVNGGTVGAKAVLTADIVVNLNVPADGNLNGATMHSWTPIGTSSKKYVGTFDGNGHTISGLYFENTTDGNYPNGGRYVGLIGNAYGATIKNVGVINSYIEGYQNVGGICGYADAYSNTTITNCYNTGTVSGYSYVGGICGYSGAQTNCHNTGTVSGSYGYAVGGICGYGYYGAQTNCYNTGTVSGSGSSNVGGICGESGTQTNCYYLEGCGSKNTLGVSATADEFGSGKITYLLNGSTSGNNNVWRQNLGDGNDAYPVLDNTHRVVYATQPCESEFSNTPNVHKDHGATNGIGYCPVCCRYTTAATLTDGVYQIDNAAQLYWFAQLVNSGETTVNAVLTANIEVNVSVIDENGNLNGTPTYSWTPIGTSSYKYEGTFDGNSHTISGLYFDNTTSDNYPNGGIRVGLIGHANGATIKNVGVIDSYIRGRSSVGGICGYSTSGNTKTTITNCYNTGTVSGSGENAGGICGNCFNSTTITNCYNTGAVSGSGCVGGICGFSGAQTNCYNTGTVSGNYEVGGICGYSYNGAQTNCYNTGTVSGSSTSTSVGGICGYYGTQTNCYYLEGCGSKNTLGVSATADEFGSGKITYLLNGSTSGNNNAWRQNLDNGNDVDAYPVLDNHAVVYAKQPCTSGFSNSEGAAVNPHSSVNEIGFCPVCGRYTTAATLTDGVYQIGNAAQLYWFADFVNNGEANANAVLTADITVNATIFDESGNLNGTPTYSWTPIGTYSKEYKGTFDGNGHTISGLYFSNTTDKGYPYGGNYVGLIGYANGATIKNVGVVKSYLNGYEYVGGISGYCEGSTITNCYNTGEVSGSSSCVGGICGYDYNSTTIINCYNTGTISGSGGVGGICGFEGTQTNCYNTGTVSGTSSHVGGICGGYGTVTNCYNTGTVSGSSSVGGICGEYGTQSNCYNTGTVSGSGNYVGGICGENGTQSNCYNTGTVSGSERVGGICGYSYNVAQTNCYYLEGCAKDGNNVVQYGVGNTTTGQTTADVAGKTISATTEEFASGKITYLLNGNTSEGDNTWRQNLDNGNDVDAYPVLDNHAVVYAMQPCTGGFSNTEGAVKEHPSMTATGFCTACGKYIAQIPTLITESNYSNFNLTVDFVGYYAISKSADLYWFADLVNNGDEEAQSANAVLTADIEVNKNVLNNDGTLNSTPTYSWTPIGTYDKKFQGIFDGNSHTISGLYFNNTTQSFAGLIGYASGATIKNVGVIDSYIKGYKCVGGICGYSYYEQNANITNCYNTGTVSGSSFYVGGICGSNGILTNCYNTGTVSCSATYDYSVGGICGAGGTQTNCYNTGTVSGSSFYVGGICGEGGGQTNCYYLEGCATDGNNVVQYGVGNSTKGQTTADKAGKTISATAEEFASGKITYLLNGGTSGDDNTWRQNLNDGNDTDAYPVLDKNHKVVYATQPCTIKFSNTEGAVQQHSTTDAIGRCTACGKFACQGTLVTENNRDSLNLTADFVGYYAIGNAAQLYWFADLVNNGDEEAQSANAVLIADIVVNENVLNDDGTLNGTPTYSWTPIGTSSNNFKGTFDGNGHTVSGLYFNKTTDKDYPNGGNNVGLIGYANGAAIKNVGVIGSYIKGYSSVGGICGFEGTQTNCYNTGTVSGSYSYVGGICGYGGIQTNCYNIGTVSGSHYVGGICGYFGHQTNCYNTGEVSGSHSVGGICGYGGTQTNCYNTGTVSGSSSYVGGICGRVSQKKTNCYYLAGCAKDGDNVVQYGQGNSTQGQTTADYAESTVAATAEEFASGKIGYLLNKKNNNAWYQDLYSDEYPLLDNTHNLVSGYIDVVDDTYTVVGNVYLATNYEVAEGKTLSVPAGASLTTGEAVITNNGTIIVNGNSTISGNDLEGSGSFLFNDLLAETEFVLNTTSYTYKGTVFTLEDGIDYTLGRTYCGKLFLFNGSYTVSYNNNLNTGTATVTITNSADAENVVSKEFTISAKEVELVWENTTLTYNGSAQKPTATATGMVNGEELTVTVSGEQTNAGTYTATASISDNNYKLPEVVTKEFTIGKATPTYTAPENLSIKCNESLANITLTAGFAFENLNVELTEGDNTLTVKFTPEDTDNYKVVEGIEVKVVKAAHTAVPDAAVPATCTESGLTEGSHCSVCNEVLVAQEEIPATGHKADSVAIENIVAATRTAAGSYDSVVYCSVCRVELSRTTIEVPQIVAETIKLASKPNKVDYKQGEALDVKGGKITIGYSDKSTEDYEILTGWVSGFDSQKVGKQTLTVKFETVSSTLTTTFDVTVKEADNTAIDEDAAEISIYAYSNIIVVEAADAITGEIAVFDVNGRMVRKTLAAGTRTEIQMQRQGLYIVRYGNQAKRVVINE